MALVHTVVAPAWERRVEVLDVVPVLEERQLICFRVLVQGLLYDVWDHLLLKLLFERMGPNRAVITRISVFLNMA